MKKIGLISPSILMVVLLSFSMSFFSVKCDKEELIKIKGIDFLIGKDLSIKNPINKEIINNELKPNIWAIIPFTFSLLGIGFYFFSTSFKKYLIIGIFSLVSILSLLFLRHNIKYEIENNKDIILDLCTQWGFIFITILLLINSLLCFIIYFIMKKTYN